SDHWGIFSLGPRDGKRCTRFPCRSDRADRRTGGPADRRTGGPADRRTVKKCGTELDPQAHPPTARPLFLSGLFVRSVRPLCFVRLVRLAPPSATSSRSVSA